MRFGFIEAEKANHSINLMCEVLGVSTSGFYAWRERKPSKRALEDELIRENVVEQFHLKGGKYGSPRLKGERGLEKVGRHRIARILREERLCARQKRAFRIATTDSNHHEQVPENLLARDFSSSQPNEKWVGDITYLPTRAGFIYLAVLLDLHSRRVVGWSMSNSLHADLALEALNVALATRTLQGRLMHHTDRGVQYVSQAYVSRLRQCGIQRSMSRKGNCWDNAPAESFFSSLKMELPNVASGRLDAREARRAVLDYLEWYNLERKHSAVGNISPAQYENAARMGRAA